MIWQNRNDMRPQIREFGCYYLSLIWIAAYKTNLPVDVDMINEKLYWRALKRKAMTETCYMLNPVILLRDMNVEVASVSKEPASYQPRADELVVGQWKAKGDISHFVPMLDGRVAYDSWYSLQGGSRAVRDGELLSYRIFRR